MNIHYKTYISEQGRTIIRFSCYRGTKVAAVVEVNQFIHLESDIAGATWDPQTKKYVAHYADQQVGDYNDWQIEPIVKMAAHELDVVVPSDLWYTPDDDFVPTLAPSVSLNHPASCA
jgi:hypothetical protein